MTSIWIKRAVAGIGLILLVWAVVVAMDWGIDRIRPVLHPQTGCVFPPLEEIERVQVDSFSSQVVFEAPPSSWADLFMALSPSEYDAQPSKWAGLASLNIRTRKGEDIVVHGYSVSAVRGAFSVCLSDGSQRYYRGGSTSRLQEAIAEAQSGAARNAR